MKVVAIAMLAGVAVAQKQSPSFPGLEEVGEQTGVQHNHLIPFNNYADFNVTEVPITWRVVGGDELSPEFSEPWMGAYSRSSGGNHFCGASLIHPNWAISAAHCCSGINNYVNFHRHNERTSCAQENCVPRRVTRHIQHPNYQSFNMKFDHCLLELAEPVNDITPIAYYRGTASLAGERTTVLGWGALREGGLQSPTLQVLSGLEVQNNNNCGVNGVSDDMICAGGVGGFDACQGDSGGPLFLDTGSNAGELVGLVSWGQGCARPGLAGVYARMGHSDVTSWVDQHVPRAQPGDVRQYFNSETRAMEKRIVK